MTLGRPTLYKEEYCLQLVEHMKEGKSFESFAPLAGVNRDTLYEWERVHPSFSDAKKMGKDWRLLWIERQMDLMITGVLQGNPALLIFKARNVEKQLYGDAETEKKTVNNFNLTNEQANKIVEVAKSTNGS